MGPIRLSQGGRVIDRSHVLNFRYNGQAQQGFAGDSVASALLAAGILSTGRSLKYRRPRGPWGAGAEEPNAFVDIGCDGRHAPGLRATTEALRAGMEIHSLRGTAGPWGALPTWTEFLGALLPAGFYYKTFIRPSWDAWRPWIRRRAGMGRLDPRADTVRPVAPCDHACDLLVVGAGAAGLVAAVAAAEAGRSVVLVDEQPHPGGRLRHRSATIDGLAAPGWVAACMARLVSAGARVLLDTSAFGAYEHGLVALEERRGAAPARLWRVRARRTVVASGAIERPLLFESNDRPGILSADAALAYLVNHGVLVGRRVAVATNNDSAHEVAQALARAGAWVCLLDERTDANVPAGMPCEVRTGRRVTAAEGRARVRAVRLDDGTRLEVDALLVSGGWTPTVHLLAQSREQIAWSEPHQAFLPVPGTSGSLRAAGACAGATSLAAVLQSGLDAVADLLPMCPPVPVVDDLTGSWAGRLPAIALSARHVFVDMQSDVTAADVALAARENYVSVEHLKRYTTLGMSADQGKTSNTNGLALLAAATGREIGKAGFTTYRPPYSPVSIEALAGVQREGLIAPPRRLPLEAEHRLLGAQWREYGGWLRPACYGAGDADARAREEARQARSQVAVFDASPLGKIDVIGPDAGRLLDFVCYHTVSTLAPGRCRYVFMLRESGVVFDDGVLVRLAEHHFVVSCSSSHVVAVREHLEEWRQDRGLQERVFVHDATAASATVTVSGPAAGELLARLDGLELPSLASLEHMALARGRHHGQPLRVARVSFTGDRSYECTVPVQGSAALWQDVLRAGEAFGLVPIGLEALMILRAEKGYIVTGRDTDGTTMPQDLGLDGPLKRRPGPYVGQRSLLSPHAQSDQRAQLVGLAVEVGAPLLPVGAHVVDVDAGGALHSAGFVTSSCWSPTLERPIAIGLVRAGGRRLGERIELRHMGRRLQATVAPVCAYDPEGSRLHG
jgi:sarcosine oxidase subunit alpha